jgi:hypothetical protein
MIFLSLACAYRSDSVRQNSSLELSYTGPLGMLVLAVAGRGMGQVLISRRP